jgi:hypothetical protein
MAGRDAVEIAVILVEPQTAFDLGKELPLRGVRKCSYRGEIQDETARSVGDRYKEHPAGGEFERTLQGARFFIGFERWKGTPTVAADGCPEVKFRSDLY